MQFIIRLSLCILLGIPAIFLVFIVGAVTVDAVSSYNTVKYFKATTCKQFLTSLKEDDKESLNAFRKNWDTTGDKAMEMIDGRLAAANFTLPNLIEACMVNPQQSLYRTITLRMGEDEVITKFVDTFNVVDSRMALDKENAEHKADAMPDISTPQPGEESSPTATVSTTDVSGTAASIPVVGKPGVAIKVSTTNLLPAPVKQK